MNKEYFFISGLPRSGSTLLSAIFRQNPDFHADIASPLSDVVLNVIETLTQSEQNQLVSEDVRKTILKNIFDGYYDRVNKPIIFDTSRGWSEHTELIKSLFPYTKIICCVRDINWILDSFERLYSKNALFTNFFPAEENNVVGGRCHSLMTLSKNGLVIKSLYFLQDGLARNPNMIHLVEYEDLCKKPKETLKKIYNFLEKEYFDHDYNNVEYSNEIFDAGLNLKDMHTVRKNVEWIDRKTILPEYVLNEYKNKEFWRNNILNYE